MSILEQSGTVMVDGGASKSINLTATGAVKASAGKLDGIIVNSHTSGVVKFWDAATQTGALGGSITFASGERFIPFFGLRFETALLMTATGTLDVTVVYR